MEPERIRDTPLSELAFVGAGIGAALGGMRPIVEVMTVNFSLLALDQIVNNVSSVAGENLTGLRTGRRSEACARFAALLRHGFRQPAHHYPND